MAKTKRSVGDALEIPYRNIDLLAADVTVRAEESILVGGYVWNDHATDVRYLKLYDALIADITVGTTTPLMTIGLPAQRLTKLDQGDILFEIGIAAAATTDVAGNAAPSANDVVINLLYRLP